MSVLVFGASGLLGSNVAVTAADRDLDVTGTYHTTEPDLDVDCYECDITERQEIRRLLDLHDPEVVINCAAMTEVDECERRPDVAREINAEAPRTIARQCSRTDTRLVHISTDYVFSGNQDQPYTPEDETAPIQQYGQTKLAGERAVVSTAASALVLRLSFVYGTHRLSGEITGFPAWVAAELKAGNEVPLFTDQYVTPSHTGQVAETIFEFLDSNADGVYHVACRDCTTPYSFGKSIAERLDTDGSITESKRADVERLASRPAYTCLDVEKTERQLDRSQPGLDADLDRIDFD